MSLLGACSPAVNHVRLRSPEDGVGCCQMETWDDNVNSQIFEKGFLWGNIIPGLVPLFVCLSIYLHMESCQLCDFCHIC